MKAGLGTGDKGFPPMHKLCLWDLNTRCHGFHLLPVVSMGLAVIRCGASNNHPKRSVFTIKLILKERPFLLTHLFGGVPKACGLVVAVCSLLVASV